MTKRSKQRKKRVPDAVEVSVPKSTHQPSRKELREELDMPGLSRSASQRAFNRPFDFRSA